MYQDGQMYGQKQVYTSKWEQKTAHHLYTKYIQSAFLNLRIKTEIEQTTLN